MLDNMLDDSNKNAYGNDLDFKYCRFFTVIVKFRAYSLFPV